VRDVSPLVGLSLAEVYKKYKIKILVCAAKRGNEIVIPDGNFVLEAKDAITLVGSVAKIVGFFKKLGIPTTSAKDTLIIGGGETAYYLAEMLISMGIQVKIIEVDKDRCLHLSEALPQAMIIWGDGTDRDLLIEEGLGRAGSIVTMTNVDEENIPTKLNAPGLRHVALSVDNFEEAVERVRSLGVEIVEEPVTFPNGVGTMFFRDIEGNILHLISRKTSLI